MSMKLCHVTKSRSDTDNVINNPAINRFNDAISKFANGNDIFYLDANILFDYGFRPGIV